MSSARVALGPLCAVVLAALGCGDDAGEDVTPGFAARSADVCDTRTSSVGLTTATGGRLSLDVRDACGRTSGTCRGADVYAARARGSVRIAGGAIFLDDCTIAATPGATLVATFTLDDAATASERFELALVGACRSDGGAPDGGAVVCGRDAGVTSPDASVAPDGGSIDAGPPRDAAP